MQGMLPTRWIEVKSEIASGEMVCTVSFEVISELQRTCRQHHPHAVAGMQLQITKIYVLVFRFSVHALDSQHELTINSNQQSSALCLTYTLTPSLSWMSTLGVFLRRAFTVCSWPSLAATCMGVC